MANILSTTTSALAAAQAGLATTAHNIANAKTPGYNRQIVLQAALGGQNEGGGFIGKGTEVVSVRRVYNEYLGSQIRAGQTVSGQLESHYTQASRINNLLADPTSGLSPVLQDFFKSIQNLAANPDARGSVLAAAESLASRFQTLDGQLRSLRVATNEEISTSITSINSYAKQIADLNHAIAGAESGSGQLPNDLLDQRDYLVEQLSKITKVSVAKDGNSYGIFIGNGQPLVVGSNVSELTPVPSPTDANEIAVGMVTSNGTIYLADSSLPGGKLGGLFEFRATTLTDAQNALGRLAIGFATTINDQHRLGLTQNGVMGGNFFNMTAPEVVPNANNAGNGELAASITDVSELKASDYKVAFDGTNYTVTRLSDRAQVYPPNPAFPADPIDGVQFTLASGTMQAGDSYVVKPTVNAAAGFSVLVTDTTNIAAAAPVSTSTPMSNAGSGTISDGQVDEYFDMAWTEFPVTMVYDEANNQLNAAATGPGTGFAFPVKVEVEGVSTIYPANTPVPYTPGSTITFGAAVAGPPADVGGASVDISGNPADGDQFTVAINQSTSGDNRNMVRLGELQTANTLVGGTTTYQGALGQMVSAIGNKTHELEVGKDAQANLVSQLQQAQDSKSGVNLDEEAANLLSYQQAYTAAAKVMQAVKEMFDVLVSLGR